MGQGLSEWKKKFWTERESKTETSNYWLRDSLFENYDSAFDSNGRLASEDQGTATKSRRVVNRDYFALAKYLRAIGNFVHILTQDKGIQVMYNRKGDNSTNGKIVNISPKIEEDKFDVSVGLALHEASHILYTDFPMYTNWIERTSEVIEKAYGVDGSYLARSIFNIIEDRFIDAMTYKMAPGYRGYYSALYQEFFGDKEIISGLWSEDYAEVTQDNYLFHIVNLSSPARNLKALPSLDKIYALMDLENILQLKTTGDRLRLAEQIIDIILRELQNAQSLPQAGGGASSGGSAVGGGAPAGATPAGGVGASGQGDEDEEEEEDDEDGNGEEDEEDTAGDDEDEKEDEGTTDIQDRPVFKLTDAQKKKVSRLFNKQKDLINNTKKVRGGEISVQESNFINSIAAADITIEDVIDSELQIQSKTFVVNHLDKTMVNTELGSLFGAGYRYDRTDREYEADRNQQAAVNRGIAGGRILANRLKLRTEDKVLTSTRLKSGKIDRRLLHEVGFDNYDIFHKINIDSYNPSYVHISLDQSGSMSGTKWYRAIELASMIATASTIVKNIRVVVSIRSDFAGFGGNGYSRRSKTSNFGSTMGTGTYNSGSPYIAIVFDSKTDTLDQIRSVFPYLRVTGATPEGMAYAAIIDDIVRESQNTDAYFINVCDGEPTYGNGKEHTKKMRNRMEAHGIKILAYFTEDASWGFRSGHALVVPSTFSYMFGEKNSVAVPAINITQIANTMNRKLLEK